MRVDLSRSSIQAVIQVGQAAQAAGMYSLIAGFGYLGDDDRADGWFSHGWLDTPLDLLRWLDTQARSPKINGNGSA